MKKLLLVCIILNARAIHTEPPKLTPLENLAVGGIAGIAAVTATEPFTYWKNRRQQNLPLSTNHLHWYRGWFINAAGSVPSLALQNMVYQQINKQLTSTNIDQSYKDLISAMAAGGSSAFIFCPRSTLTIHQQNQGENIIKRINTFVQQHGFKKLFRGLLPIGIVSCSFAGSVFVVTPKIKELVSEKTDNKIIQTFAPGLMTGLVHGVLSHPLDTIKTQMQANVGSLTTLQTTLNIYRNGIKDKSPNPKPPVKGIPAFFCGIVPRALGVSISIFVVGFVKDYLTNEWQKRKETA